MTPLIYQKIIKTLSYIYSKSAVDEKIDLFRFKDVLDSYSEGQYKSKLWAVKELEKHNEKVSIEKYGKDGSSSGAVLGDILGKVFKSKKKKEKK